MQQTSSNDVYSTEKGTEGDSCTPRGHDGSKFSGTPSSLELWTSLIKTRPNPSPYSDFIKRSIQGCRDGLAVKGSRCSCRRPEFVSLASLTGDSQLPVTPAPEHVTPSCGLCRHLHSHVHVPLASDIHIKVKIKILAGCCW